MKAKILGFLFGFLIVLMLFSNFSSAALSLTLTSAPTSVEHNVGNILIEFTLKNTGASSENITWTTTVTQPAGAQWVLIPSLSEIDAGETVALSAILRIPSYSSGSIIASLNANSAVLPIEISIIDTPRLAIEVLKSEITQNQTGKIKLKNAGNTNLVQIELTSIGDFEVTFSANNLALLPGNSAEIEVAGVDLSNLGFGTNSVTIKARDITGTEATANLFNKQTFCKSGSVGDKLKITNIEFDTSGEKEFEWEPLDRIEIMVDVENKGSININDVIVEIGLFDSEGKNIIDELDFENKDEEKIEIGKLSKNGDEDTATFTFKVPPGIKEGDYKLAIKVYSDDLGESKECSDTSNDLDYTSYQTIDILSEDDEGKFIAFDNIEISPNQPTCGETVTVNLDLYNIGDEDQDQVKVNLVNEELSINLEKEIKKDMEYGDKVKASFSFIIPENIKDGKYTFSLIADYDYRRGVYRMSSDESTDFDIEVKDCSFIPPTEKLALITAKLESNAKAGEELIVKATITSLSPGQKDFIVRATGYESWASLNSISKSLISLNQGEAKEIILSFNINSDVEGEQSFELEAISENKTESREIAVNIAPSIPGSSWNFLSNNTLIWIIAIINIILIILIIIVAARISRR